MSRNVLSLTLLALVSTLLLVSCGEEKLTSLETKKQEMAYAVGSQVGNDFAQLETLNLSEKKQLKAFLQGFSDTILEKPLLLADEEIQQRIVAFRTEQKEVARKRYEGSPAYANLKEGEAFLEKNQKKEGVKVTESGLQYEVIKEGSGPSPKGNDTVSVHYEGKLIDGTVFDSSIKRGEPTQFTVRTVIRGWQEALGMMKKGSKYRLYIPSYLAYGERGASGHIPPNSVLIFEVELLDIN